MKVLLCSPWGGAVGGISRWTGHIKEHFDSIKNTSNIDLNIFSLTRSRGVYANTNIVFRIYLAIMDYSKITHNFYKEISSNEYNIIHIVSSGSFGLLRDLIFLILIDNLNLKSVIHFRFGRIPEILTVNNWEKFLLKKVLDRVSKIIVIDEKSYDSLKLYGYANIEYLPNPINSNVIKYTKSKMNVRRNVTEILFTGHVVETKGIFELIEATKDIEGITIKVIGHISDDIKSKILGSFENNLSKLIILGELNYNETLYNMLSSGIFVLPTYTEGFPNVILECMACRIPIVTTNVGAIPEMLNIYSDTPCGVCVEPRDVEGLRREIIKMINNPSLANKFAENAYERVNRFYTMPIIWEKMENIWKSI